MGDRAAPDGAQPGAGRDAEELGRPPDVVGEERVRAAVRRRLFGDVAESGRETLPGPSFDDDGTLREAGRDADAPAIDPSTPAVGDSIGRFEVRGRIGHGGMGVVYVGYDPELDREVAIKVLRPDLLRGDVTASRARLRREARTMAKLAHPNVATVHEVGTVGDRLFVAMELVEGQTLGAWIQSGPRPWREVVGVLVRAGRGLAAAHAAGLVHRDFKPDNVLLGNDGRVCVVDFGLARPVGTGDEQAAPSPDAEADASPITQTGALMGTPAYMAPEQLMGHGADELTDQFSFCASLYESLYGQRAFAGRTITELLSNVAEGRVRAPPADTTVPAWLRDAVLRGLSPDRGRRWPSMDALIDALTVAPARRRRAIVATVSVASLAAIVAAAVTTRDPVGAACDHVDAELARVWNDDTRASVRDGLLATGAPFAETVAASTDGLLDAYADRWASLAGEACTAAAVASDDDAALHDSRRACLDWHLRHVGEVVELLSKADAQLAQRAVKAAGSLADPATCLDARRLRAWALPADEAARARLDHARGELAAADAMMALGRYEDGRGRAEAALTAAREAGHVPSEIHALYLLGKLDERTGEPARAEKHLREALARAEHAGDDLARARVLIQLVHVVGRERRRADEANALAEQADALLDVAEGDALLRAHLLTARGIVARRAREPKAALSFHRDALAILREHLGEDHPDTAMSLANIGTVLNDARRPEEAETSLRDALERYRRVLGPEHPHVAIALGNLGISLVRQDRHADAVDVFMQALRIRERALGPEHPALATTEFNLGRALVDVERVAEGLEHLRRGLAIRERKVGPDDASLADWLLAIGRAEHGQGEASAAATLERALKLREGDGATARKLAPIRFALARAIVASDRPRALVLARAARNAYRDAGSTGAADEIDGWLTSPTP